MRWWYWIRARARAPGGGVAVAIVIVVVEWIPTFGGEVHKAVPLVPDTGIFPRLDA